METLPSMDRRRGVPLLVALVLASVVLLVVGARVATTTHPTAAEQMVAVYPGGEVDIDELTPELRQLYLDVAADPGPFEHVRCYCGCEAMLDHRHLRDCFERPDGGWERHAVGCGICQVEARDVLAARVDGRSLEDITTMIDETYAGITEESS